MTAGYLLLANPAAGSADDEVVDAVSRTLARSGPVEQVEPNDEKLDAAIRDADGRCLVVVGGDGSIHRVADRLHRLGRLDVEVGLIPLGTGNDLARGLGLPLDPEAAAAALAEAGVHPIDLMAGNDGVVVNAVHMGLGAEAAKEAGRWKKRFGKLAYPLGAVVAGAWATPWQLRVTVDGKVLHEGVTVLAGIGNGRTIGGGTAMFPRAVVDDGQAEVLVAASRYGRPGRVVFGNALARGRHRRLPWVRTARGRHVEVSGEPTTGNADGELWPAERDWEIEVLPRALRLRRP